MQVTPFKSCAARYLSMWARREQELHRGLRSVPTPSAVHAALSYFEVARSFKGIDGERVQREVLRLLVARAGQPTRTTAAGQAIALAKDFERRFGKYNISAASKLLWLTWRSPFIVRDRRAADGLRALGYHFDDQDYADYCAKWRDAYASRLEQIAKAARQLPAVYEFTDAYNRTAAWVQKTSAQPWFLERVFDQFLWRLGGDAR